MFTLLLRRTHNEKSFTSYRNNWCRVQSLCRILTIQSTGPDLDLE